MPNSATATIDETEHLVELIREFRVAMFTTMGPGGKMVSRPLSIAHDDTGHVLYFPTTIDSQKVAQIAQDPRVYITMQSDKVFLALDGHASVTADPALVERLWSEPWKVWFKGKDDPTLCIIAFTPQSGEYWDNSGTEGLKYLFDAAKAWIKGTRPEASPEQHARVKSV